MKSPAAIMSAEIWRWSSRGRIRSPFGSGQHLGVAALLASVGCAPSLTETQAKGASDAPRSVPRAEAPESAQDQDLGEAEAKAPRDATSAGVASGADGAKAGTSPGAAPSAASPTVSLASATCPEGMARVTRMTGTFCIDRYEGTLVRVSDGKTPWPSNEIIDGREKQVLAVSVAGKKPQGYISGKQADQVCRNAGKRLCEIGEWVTACRGTAETRYPYGNVRKKDVCNDRYKVLNHHPVIRLFKKYAPPDEDPIKMWHPSWMNDKRLHLFDHTVVPTGSKEGCTNDFGVYDMVGNLHEWVADAEGTFFGGYFMDTFQNGQGCEYRTIGHPYDYHDYSTGFRCCADPTWDSPAPPSPGSPSGS